MTRLLIYEPAWRRVAARLAAHPGLQALVMDQSGAISLAGAPVSAEDAAPEIGWITADLFVEAPLRTYVAALLAAPRLGWVQSGAAGLDHPMFARIADRGARLTTNHSQSVGMSEFVLGRVLDHFHRGPERRAAQAARVWARFTYREVFGSRWLVIGFGAIGQDIAVRARGFGAHITGVRRSGGTHPAADAMATPGDVPRLLAEADVVVLSLPLSRSTAGLVDAAFLAAMKPGSVLVNVGRGGLVDEAALLAALDAGKPEFAVLDVFRNEPLEPESRFWTHPRVALSAHASALGQGLRPRGDALFLDNVGRYLAGQPLINEIDTAEVQAMAPG